jgi:hypothetical protein
VFYTIEHAREWLAQQEQPRKPAVSVRHYVQQLKRG